MGGGIGFLLGGALQGLGQGMAKQAEVNWEERKAAALAALKEKRTPVVVGLNQKAIDPETGRVIADGGTKAPDLPGIGDELVAAGYQPGTPEFKQAMVQVMNGKYATEYTDADGNVRRRSAVQLPTTIASAAASDDGVASPQSQEDYDALPPGTRYRKPNGETAVKRGPTSASGGFHVPSGNPLDPFG